MFSSLYFNYWAFATILHLVPCVKFTFVAVCIITHFASCIGQSWSDFRKGLTSGYRYAGVEATYILLLILARSSCERTNLVLNITHFELKTEFVKFCNMSQKSLKLAIGQWERIYQKCLAHRTWWRPFWVFRLVYKLFNKMVVSW